MAVGSVFLLCAAAAAAALCLAGAQETNHELTESYRKGLDLVLEQLSSHAGVAHHFRYLRSLEKSEIESGFGVRYLYHRFYLKPTWCAKGTTESSPQSCLFRNDRPLMDCAVCYKMASEQIESSPRPYVHCIQKPRLTKEMSTSRVEHCRKMTYNSGAPTLLAVSTGSG